MTNIQPNSSANCCASYIDSDRVKYKGSVHVNITQKDKHIEEQQYKKRIELDKGVSIPKCENTSYLEECANLN